MKSDEIITNLSSYSNKSLGIVESLILDSILMFSGSFTLVITTLSSEIE